MSVQTKLDVERQVMVFNVQKYNVYDGPGIRTIVFLKGCPLRCQWCSNPEGLEQKYQVMFKRDVCSNCMACVDVCPMGIHYIDENGHHQVRRDRSCNGCRKCVAVCPMAALNISGEVKTISELLKLVHEDDAFYETSGGGITLSGGECTAQPEGAITLLQACKDDGINTAIETCGYAPTENLMKIAKYVDLFLYDLKHMDPVKHNQLTGMSNEKILANLTKLLQEGYNVKIRMPMLKGINDSQEEIDAVINFLKPYKDLPNFKGINLLPYHKLGVTKYAQLGIKYPVDGDPSLSDADLDRIEGMIKKYDFPVAVIRH
ncbi:choline TMA-lyase-activating enzyme [Lacticaseibacillus baoqingensis]|uniref:Choline trimethylamine-lyase activating enzyme n=1 Tax=Lacticaseibacillus baoqingensis TaxID=2486013 RepID=A0ABW4ECF2_9LACO|nr:choline TMA-lyase-activating enzyme [Lacticaseibacillus baoqingensis]